MFIEEIKNLQLEGDIENADQVLEMFSQDASIFKVKPEIVISPKSVDDLKKIVKYAAQEKSHEPEISITARAAGTDMSGGPLNTSIILNMTKYFNHIEEIGPGYAVTEPGVYYRDFEAETLKKDLLLPPFPASRELCTVGGMAANNSAGEKTLTFGKAEDYVEELHVVLADGEEHVLKPLNQQGLHQKLELQGFEGEMYRKMFALISDNYELIKAAKPNVSKNSAGYYLWNVWDKQKGIFDLTRLFVGSQGTLGLISKIKYRLVKPTQHSKMLVIFLNDLKALGEITDTILEFKPETFESYDDKTLKLAIRFMPELIKLLAKKENIIAMGISFIPELWMMLTGGFPSLVLLAEFTGHDDLEVEHRLQEAQKAIQKFHVKSRTTDEAGARKYWAIRRESFNLLRHHIKGTRTAAFIDDFIVRPEFLPEFLPKLNKILGQYPIVYTIAGHVGNGNFHIIPLMDFKKPETRQWIPEISDKVYNLVLSYHGSITAEHNDGIIRTPYLRQMYGGNIIKLFEQTKQIFDPQDIFNPGKKVGGTLQYAVEHMVTTS